MPFLKRFLKNLISKFIAPSFKECEFRITLAVFFFPHFSFYALTLSRTLSQLSKMAHKKMSTVTNHIDLFRSSSAGLQFNTLTDVPVIGRCGLTLINKIEARNFCQFENQSSERLLVTNTRYGGGAHVISKTVRKKSY